MNRRDFLRPANLLRPAGQVLAAVDDLHSFAADKEGNATKDAVLLQFARRAMATTFEVILPFATPNAQEMASAALDRIDALEAQLTVYRDDSEVSRLNRIAHESPVAVEENLLDLLLLAKELHRQTEGAFDIATGALIKAWGFYRRAGRVPTPEVLSAVRDRTGTQHVILDEAEKTVAFDRAGIEINLGSIGKGFALDIVGRELRQLWNCRYALLHGGHSSVLGLGGEPGQPRGWQLGVMDPEASGKRLALVHLQNRGLGTSAATYQNLEHEGRKLPHLLDPRTLWPAEGMLQASVTAPCAAVADALATAFFVLGVDKSRAYCDEHPDVGAILLDSERRLHIVGRCQDET